MFIVAWRSGMHVDDNASNVRAEKGQDTDTARRLGAAGQEAW